MLFGALVVAALWRIDQITPEKGAVAHEITTGILVALPFACRTAGIAVVIAAATVAFARRRRAGWATAAMLIPVALWGTWIVGGVGVPHQGNTGYYTDYLVGWAPVVANAARIVGQNIVSFRSSPLAWPLMVCDGLPGRRPAR